MSGQKDVFHCNLPSRSKITSREAGFSFAAVEMEAEEDPMSMDLLIFFNKVKGDEIKHSSEQHIIELI